MTFRAIDDISYALDYAKDDGRSEVSSFTLHDEQKHRIAARLIVNCSLQQLEELETIAKQTINNYLSE